MEFQLLLVIILLAIATFNSLILIFKKEKYDSKYKFLYISLFFYNFCLVIYYIRFEAGFIVNAPQLLRTFSPLMYLCAPFFYFFIRNAVTGITGISKRDWIHFLPTVIHFLDLMPFYFESAETKSVLAEAIISDHSRLNLEATGIIPIQFHYLFRILLQTLYFIYSVYLVKKSQPNFFTFKNWKNHLHKDLKFVLVCLSFLVLFQFIYAFVEFQTILGLTNLSAENYLLRRLSLIGLLGLNVFANYRLGFSSESDVSNELKKAVKIGEKIDLLQSSPSYLDRNNTLQHDDILTLSQEESELIKSRIILKFNDEQLFTENGMKLNDFAQRINIPPRVISSVIKNEFDKNFNEFLNQHRIAFAVTKIEEGYLDDYTLEALGKMSGFNSRTTFFNAFKKELGCSPSEYWKKFQDQDMG